LPGDFIAQQRPKARFHWAFCDGTPLAIERPSQVSWYLSECPMLPALAALSGLNALQSLFSSSSSQSAGSSQSVSNPFDVTAGSTSSTSSQAGTAQPSIGTPGYQQISPQTMNALLEAQSQSGT
jgi:hypothetical protein